MKMKILMASMLFQQIEQALPFFLEYLQKINPLPAKIILLDFRLEQKFMPQKPPKLFVVEKKTIEKDFGSQLALLRNNAFEMAKTEGFDAVLFLQPNLFPPQDLIERLAQSGKEIIAPAFFTTEQNVVFSNAVKIENENNLPKVTPWLFGELLPSGLKKVDSVSLQAIFFKKNAFNVLSFGQPPDGVQEMVFLQKKAKELGFEIFLDSSIVCAKLSQQMLFSHHYFAAQKQ